MNCIRTVNCDPLYAQIDVAGIHVCKATRQAGRTPAGLGQHDYPGEAQTGHASARGPCQRAEDTSQVASPQAACSVSPLHRLRGPASRAQAWFHDSTGVTHTSLGAQTSKTLPRSLTPRALHAGPRRGEPRELGDKGGRRGDRGARQVHVARPERSTGRTESGASWCEPSPKPPHSQHATGSQDGA